MHEFVCYGHSYFVACFLILIPILRADIGSRFLTVCVCVYQYQDLAKIWLCFVVNCKVSRLFPYKVSYGSQVHVRVKYLQQKIEMYFCIYDKSVVTTKKTLTMSLHSNSILSSGGICEPSELASLFWLFCELFVAIAVPGVVSAPRTLSKTCSHTLRH